MPGGLGGQRPGEFAWVDPSKACGGTRPCCDGGDKGLARGVVEGKWLPTRDCVEPCIATPR